MVDVIRTLERQGLAFRGHEKSETDEGNFRQIVNLLARHVPILKNWLNETKTRSHYITYMSGNSQNKFIDSLGRKIRETIVGEIKKAGIFSVIADTTQDDSHHGRLAINNRYVQENVPDERLLKITLMPGRKSGKHLAEKIFEVINSEGLPMKKIVFQSYDFASNMSGKRIGNPEETIQTLWQEYHSYAMSGSQTQNFHRVSLR